MERFLLFCLDRPKTITGVMIVFTLILALLAALPSIWPQVFPMLHTVQVDTDPENMLPQDEPVRVFHNEMKKEFSLHDMVVLGVVNEKNPQGVFNTGSLRKIYELTEYAKTLRWPDKKDPKQMGGVIEVDLIAPSTVDNIEQAGIGSIRFEWLMSEPPKTDVEALAIRDKAKRIPFLNGTLLSGDGKALALYIPLTSKDLSYKVASKLREKIQTFKGDERYLITGLPVAEDTFGVEMFIQMAVSAPLAMLVIFLLMLYFFRKLNLILSPLIVAIVSVISTMGLLIATGHTIHIMSSMIPIFIMPIAVLDSVHILSDFFDRYQETRDRKKTILTVMETLFSPMLFTSLTTAVGFASLALAPIPPVQVFGLFVALGVMTAWIWTVSFIPAYVMIIPQKSLENFGMTPQQEEESEKQNLMVRFLAGVGRFTFRNAKLLMVAVCVLVVIAVYGIAKIHINDNPVKWFEPNHPIRVADRILNAHFGGTYMAYLALEPQSGPATPSETVEAMKPRIEKKAQTLDSEGVQNAKAVFDLLSQEAARIAPTVSSKKELLDKLESFADAKSQSAPNAEYDAWDACLLFLSEERQRDQVFKQPQILRYMSALQDYLKTIKSKDGRVLVGKSNSLADIVKTVYRELMGGKEENFRIPDSNRAVAQSLLQYQNSHRPQDLWHFVTPNYRKTSLWIQLKSGDDRDMSRVAASVENYMNTHTPPVSLKHRWFGLTYINVVWQEKMVTGMLEAFLGSFLAVLLMMIFLFRSALWGLLSMVPLTVTIGAIYGAIGFIGKDYDMPVAVLSSLSLGLAVDYAIHFLARGRRLEERYGSWKAAVGPVFGEPARAITRNVLVIGVGFLPLLVAPLVPYQTVGIFIAAILLTAGLATLLILPALMAIMEPLLFPKTQRTRFACNCGACITAGVSAVALVAINVYQFFQVGITRLTWVSIVAIFALWALCCLLSKREVCKTTVKKGDSK